MHRADFVFFAVSALELTEYGFRACDQRDRPASIDALKRIEVPFDIGGLGHLDKERRT